MEKHHYACIKFLNKNNIILYELERPIRRLSSLIKAQNN